MSTNLATSKTVANSVNPKNTMYYIHCIITLVIMFGFQFLPAVKPITPYGMNVIGIFVGLLYGWSTVGIVWPSLLGLILLGFTKYSGYSVTNAFKEGYGGDTYLFIFFILAFAAVIDSAGVTNAMAKWMVSRKIAKGRPYVLMFLLFTAAYVIAALVSVTPAIVICWSILYQCCSVYGYTNKDQYPKITVVGIVLAGMMGIASLPFKAYAIMMMGVLTKATGMTINYVTFTIFAIALGYGTTLLYLAFAKFIYKPDVTRITQSNYVYSEKESLNLEQKLVLVMLGAMVVLMFLPGFLPNGVYLKTFLKWIGNTGIVVLLLAFGVFIRKKDGTQFINYTKAIRTGVPWETMALMGTAMPIASALTATGTGVQEFLNQMLSPIFAGNGAIVLIALVVAITIIATNIMNNVVVGMILMPLIIQFSPLAGLNPQLLTVAICVIAQIAIVLPSGSPLAAFLHGNREWVSANDIYKYSIPACAGSIILNIIICMTIGQLLF